MVLTIVGVIIVLVLAGLGWCIWRFFKKKRPKGAEGKDGQDDENALVENEDANVEEVGSTIDFFSVTYPDWLFSRWQKLNKKRPKDESALDWNMTLPCKNWKLR